MRPKGSSAELERRRLHAVALLDQGMKPTQVAKAVGASLASVGRWRKAARQGRSLAAKPHPGRPTKLTATQRRSLIRLLAQGPRRHGFATELWTLERVAAVIRREFGVDHHPSAVWHILKALGWSCQKPQRLARERDEAAIRRWRRDKWPRIKKGRQDGRLDRVAR